MTAAVARLQNLPEIFTIAGFCRMTGLSTDAAAVYLRRWKVRGLIEPAGERAGIYFNKLKRPQIESSDRVSALLFEYPTAILCGESVLHAAGWITQIPAQLSVAVMARRSYVSLQGFEIRGRPRSWFRKVHEAVNAPGNERIYGLKALPPALALVDLYLDPKDWHPAVDDLDIPYEGKEEVLNGSRLLGIELPADIRQACARHETPARRVSGRAQTRLRTRQKRGRSSRPK
jgi:hypothetical protein